MIDCERFYQHLTRAGLSFFTGVPDSLLKDICAYISDHADASGHVIAASEGNAIAMAAGAHLATGGIPFVYMQNSGLGNAVNPLTSLADPEVYAIPMLLMIGWRGEPGVPDEPQHRKQGAITPAMLDVLGVEYAVLPSEQEEAEACVSRLVASAQSRRAPVAILVRKDTFSSYAQKRGPDTRVLMSRERALQVVLSELSADALVVATTGMIGREVYELRKNGGITGARDFLTVGSMGHASQIALGAALSRPSLDVVCLDGDGAMLMHMGGLAVIGSVGPANLRHVLLNNEAHDSVGGQPTAAGTVNFREAARACGYQWAELADSEAGLPARVGSLMAAKGPALLEIPVKRGARKDLARPATAPAAAKEQLMNSLRRA